MRSFFVSSTFRNMQSEREYCDPDVRRHYRSLPSVPNCPARGTIRMDP